jgi:hypothetical protein
VVVTESCWTGRTLRSTIAAIAGVAADAEVHDVSVLQLRQHASKFAEAETITDRFPALTSVAADGRSSDTRRAPQIMRIASTATAASPVILLTTTSTTIDDCIECGNIT